MRRAGRPLRGLLTRVQASPLLRSALALVLVCAQLFVAAHSLSHVGEGLAEGRGVATVLAAAAAGEDGGLPAAERHERCLVCLAAADLGAALPTPHAILPVDDAVHGLTPAPALPGIAWRAPCPPCRGPPTSA